MQTGVQAIEAAVDAAGDGGELAFVGKFVEAVALPEPGGGFAGPLWLLQQFWLSQQAIVTEQRLLLGWSRSQLAQEATDVLAQRAEAIALDKATREGRA